jgi:hypothetical protein
LESNISPSDFHACCDTAHPALSSCYFSSLSFLSLSLFLSALSRSRSLLTLSSFPFSRAESRSLYLSSLCCSPLALSLQCISLLYLLNAATGKLAATSKLARCSIRFFKSPHHGHFGWNQDDHQLTSWTMAPDKWQGLAVTSADQPVTVLAWSR